MKAVAGWQGWPRAGREARLVAWLAVWACVTPVLAQEDKLPQAEKILEKSIEARGGRAAFEKLKSRVCKGAIEVSGAEQSMRGSVASYEKAPNLQYLVMELPQGGKIEVGSNGEVFWEMSVAGASIREGEDKAIAARKAQFNAGLYWREQYEKVETLGKDDVDGRSCYKVLLTPKVGPPETVYFDRKTGLPAKLTMMQKGPMGDMPVEVVQENYREVDGVQLPFKITRKVEAMGQSQTITTTWEKIEQNVEIPADKFALPDKIKELIDKPKSDSDAKKPK
jgi:outer membrane lipoprotein-sorting protein